MGLLILVKQICGPHVKRKIKVIMITFNKNCGESFQERAQSNACLWLGTKKLLFVPIQRPASIVLLSWSSYMNKFTANSTICTCLACVGELSWRRVFSENGAHKPKKSLNLACKQNKTKIPQLKKSDCGLIKGKFVNTRLYLWGCVGVTKLQRVWFKNNWHVLNAATLYMYLWPFLWCLY